MEVTSSSLARALEQTNRELRQTPGSVYKLYIIGCLQNLQPEGTVKARSPQSTFELSWLP